MNYLKSKHYLHKAYTKGFFNEPNPYCPGTKENEWYEAGYTDGIPTRQNFKQQYLKSTKWTKRNKYQ